jgi:transposase
MEAKLMAPTGPRPVTVTLNEADRRSLETLAVDEAATQRLRVRARIVLGAAEGLSNAEIAEVVGVSDTTVTTWRRRWVDDGMDGLAHRSPTAGPHKRLGRPLEPLVLDAESREVLERWTRRSTVSAGLSRRARIVLAAAEGASNTEVAETVGCHVVTVAKWRSRFMNSGLVGLSDEYRSGRPRTISDDDVEDVIVRTLKQPPPDQATQWSTRTMAEAAGHSQSSISRMWRAFGLQPHRVNTFKLSTDPHFVDKVHDIVGLYLNPPERAIVICIDEKTGIQALDRTQLAFPMLPGSRATASHDYVRHGTIDLFAALNTGTGEVITRTDKRHRAIEFRKFLDLVADELPDDVDVHVILDNASTHKTPAIQKWLKRHPRWEFHFTPTSSSWLNLIERWFSELTTKKLQRSTHTSTRALTNDIIAWADAYNTNPRPFLWRKTADEILESLKRYLNRTFNSRH